MSEFHESSEKFSPAVVKSTWEKESKQSKRALGSGSPSSGQRDQPWAVQPATGSQLKPTQTGRFLRSLVTYGPHGGLAKEGAQKQPALSLSHPRSPQH